MRLLVGLLLILFLSGCLVKVDPRALDEDVMGEDVSGVVTLVPGAGNDSTGNTIPVVEPGSSSVSGDANTTVPAVTPPMDNQPTTPTTITLSSSEVAKHASKKNCWVIYSGSVYDISAFTTHPGGNVYVPYCGKDMTKAYNQQGHSGKADRILGGYLLGKLGDAIPA